MNRLVFIIVMTVLLLFGPITGYSQKKVGKVRVPLKLVMKNLVANAGPVIVGIYGIHNKFPDPNDQLKVYKFKTKGTDLVANIRSLKFGTYALAIYQDVNRDGKIDKDFIGIPTEPYAFSNNYHPKIKAPDFNDCNFSYNATNNIITMEMIR